MKSLFFTCLLAAPLAFAQPEAMPPLICSGVTTSTTAMTATSQTLSGYIAALQIGVGPEGVTATVSVATSGPLKSRTVYTGDATGTNLVRPVVVLSTNQVDVAAWAREFLASESLVLSTHSATNDTNVVSATITVIPVIERQP